MYVIGQAESRAVQKVIASGKLFRYHDGKINPCLRNLERALARKIGTRHVLATNSGTTSLMCALAGLRIGPGDEVIVPGYTFIATAMAPIAVGAVPVLAEVDASLTLDPADVERKITRRTKAIIPVYMLGLPCNMDAMLRIGRKHGIPIVEDAAQGCGGSYHGKRFGSMGAVGAFSFNYYKIICCGEGGAVVTNDRQLFDGAVMYHDCGCSFFMHERPATVPFFAGFNCRMSVVQSAILVEQLKRLEGILAGLRARKRELAGALAGADGFMLSPNYEPKGDCATHLPLQFATAEAAQAYVTRNQKRCAMFRPIDTGRHVYSHWEPVLRQLTHNAKASPWRAAGRSYRYSKTMLPQTSDVLARTVCLRVPLEKTLGQVKKLARELAN